MSQDPNQPPQPQWDAQQGRWVLPGQPQPQYTGQGQPYGQPGAYGYGQPSGPTPSQPYGQPSGQWPPQAPPPPRKTRKWPWVVGGIVLLFVVIGIAGGNSGTPTPTGGTTAAPATTSAAVPGSTTAASSAPAAAPSASEPQAASGVVFEVSGSGRSTSITYGVNGGISQENGERLPWTKTVPAEGGFGIYSLTAQSGGSGNITCRITVDGAVVAEQTSTGQYAVVSCSGNGSPF